jgi:translation initiation factor IF-1
VEQVRVRVSDRVRAKVRVRVSDRVRVKVRVSAIPLTSRSVRSTRGSRGAG